MASITILEFLYLVLIFFSTIIGTLLIIILVRLLKILGVFIEIVNVYIKIKQILMIYSKIPELIKEKIFSLFSKKEEEEKKEEVI